MKIWVEVYLQLKISKRVRRNKFKKQNENKLSRKKLISLFFLIFFFFFALKLTLCSLLFFLFKSREKISSCFFFSKVKWYFQKIPSSMISKFNQEPTYFFSTFCSFSSLIPFHCFLISFHSSLRDFTSHFLSKQVNSWFQISIQILVFFIPFHCSSREKFFLIFFLSKTGEIIFSEDPVISMISNFNQEPNYCFSTLSPLYEPKYDFIGNKKNENKQTVFNEKRSNHP